MSAPNGSEAKLRKQQFRGIDLFARMMTKCLLRKQDNLTKDFANLKQEMKYGEQLISQGSWMFLM